MSRISYRCLPEERKLPVAEKTQWNVYLGNDCVGCIIADKREAKKERSHSLRVWRAVIYSGFDPFEFPHADPDDELDSVDEPYVMTNDDKEASHNLELHAPSLMTMTEARNWLRSIVKGD